MDGQTKEYLLKIKNLTVEYHAGKEVCQAVNHVDLSVRRGETIGLVGETGAGKTTMALSIMKLLPNPDRVSFMKADELLFDGMDLLKAKSGDMRAIRGEKISMIFQDPMTSLNPLIPVGKQIGEALELHNKTNKSSQEIQEEVGKILVMVGIPKQRAGEYPHQFSGGMKQRVVIAMALSCSPELLIADEPTTALDVTIQAQVLDMMKGLKKELGTSMIMITHDLGIIAETCDKVAVMYAGEIIERGNVEDIFEGREHHPYTVGLMGAIPDLSTETERLSPIEGIMPDPMDLPSGCKFHDRCPHCMEICKTQNPPDYRRGTQSIKCHLMGGKKEFSCAGQQGGKE